MGVAAVRAGSLLSVAPVVQIPLDPYPMRTGTHRAWLLGPLGGCGLPLLACGKGEGQAACVPQSALAALGGVRVPRFWYHSSPILIKKTMYFTSSYSFSSIF